LSVRVALACTQLTLKSLEKATKVPNYTDKVPQATRDAHDAELRKCRSEVAALEASIVNFEALAQTK
jgi:hypothetical protein